MLRLILVNKIIVNIILYLKGGTSEIEMGGAQPEDDQGREVPWSP